MFSERFENALVFMHRLHQKQKRKTSGVPYVGHLVGVASLVIEDGGTEDEAIAALLHDALEDQGYYYPGGVDKLAEEIERQFGSEVRCLVERLTERSSPQERGIADKRARWRAHKQGYIDQICSAEASVLRISCADSVHNVRTMIKDYRRMGDQMWTRFLTRSREDQLWAYQAAALAYRDSGAGPLADDLLSAIEELQRVSEPKVA